MKKPSTSLRAKLFSRVLKKPGLDWAKAPGGGSYAAVRTGRVAGITKSAPRERTAPELGKPPRGLVLSRQPLTHLDVDVERHREMIEAAEVRETRPEDFKRIRAQFKR